MARPRFITKIHWENLKRQKETLLATYQTVNHPDEIADLDGIIHLIDALQDYAVDVMGISEEEVFHKNNKS